jgi:hypothetical protein
MRNGSLAVSFLALGSLASAAGAEAVDGNSWSGYVLKGATFTAVTAMWTQPTVAGTAEDAPRLFLGWARRQRNADG